jgi:hypothetical protein
MYKTESYGDRATTQSHTSAYIPFSKLSITLSNPQYQMAEVELQLEQDNYTLGNRYSRSIPPQLQDNVQQNATVSL